MLGFVGIAVILIMVFGGYVLAGGKMGIILKALPFEMRVPNKLTAETLAKSERGEDVHSAKDADDLFQQLGI